MENETQITVTGSYSENISPENHGLQGMRFENRSFFLSAQANLLQRDATPEKIKEVAAMLHLVCKEACKEAARIELRELKQKAGMTTEPTGEEYKAIADIIVSLESATTLERVEEALATIENRKDKLNEVQLDFLDHISRKASARLI